MTLTAEQQTKVQEARRAIIEQYVRESMTIAEDAEKLLANVQRSLNHWFANEYGAGAANEITDGDLADSDIRFDAATLQSLMSVFSAIVSTAESNGWTGTAAKVGGFRR